MLIEVNVSKELPSEIWVMDPDGKKFLQEVTYDWKPSYCEKCLMVGHNCVVNSKPSQPPPVKKPRVIQEWRTKAPNQNVQKQQEAPLQQAETRQSNVIQRDQQGPPPMPTEMNKQGDKGKQAQSPEFNLTNFPPLSPIVVSNRFEPMSISRAEIPPDEGGPSSYQ